MFDLALTESGDLFFLEEDIYKKDLKINFNVSVAKTLKITFKINQSNPMKKQTENDFAISFNIKNRENNKTALTLNGNNALAQAIKIRLLTAVGEINQRPNLGSRLQLIKHESLHDSNVHLNAAITIKEAISDILPNAVIKVNPEINYDFGYHQILCVYIYNDSKLIYKHSI